MPRDTRPPRPPSLTPEMLDDVMAMPHPILDEEINVRVNSDWIRTANFTTSGYTTIYEDMPSPAPGAPMPAQDVRHPHERAPFTVRLSCTSCNWNIDATLDSLQEINILGGDTENIINAECGQRCSGRGDNNPHRVIRIFNSEGSTIYNNRTACARCGHYGMPRTAYQREDRDVQMYCAECYDHVRQSEVIYNHSWIPSRFHLLRGSDEKPYRMNPLNPVDRGLYYGTELEINVKGNVYEHALKFKDWLRDEGVARYFYFKKDGSINNGYEIVTHPMTMKARNEYINWYKLCKFLKETGASSEESGECGLHIHASRQALTHRDIGNLKYFFWTNRHQLAKLSRRENFRYCQMERHSVKDRGNRWGKKERYLREFPETGDRYTAVNTVTGKHTVEFRLMRGTIDHERLISYFQLTDAVIHFAKSHSVLSQDTPYTWGTFRKWIKSLNSYEHLRKYLEKEEVV